MKKKNPEKWPWFTSEDTVGVTTAVLTKLFRDLNK